MDFTSSFVHIGTDYIQKDLWYDVQNGKKPIGGLWTSPYIPECVCDWLEFVGENPEQFLYSNIKNGCFVNLNHNVKIFSVEGKSDFDLLYQKYSQGDIIDFEKLNKEYDCFYVNPLSISNSSIKEKQNFKNWHVRTLYILNYDAIKSYTPFSIKSRIISPYYIDYKIENIKEEKLAKDYSEDYFKLLEIFEKRYEKILKLANKNEIKHLFIDECVNLFKEKENIYLTCDAIVENKWHKIKKLSL